MCLSTCARRCTRCRQQNDKISDGIVCPHLAPNREVRKFVSLALSHRVVRIYQSERLNLTDNLILSNFSFEDVRYSSHVRPGSRFKDVHA
jgi:hypothetical protein